jgi:TonB family protein
VTAALVSVSLSLFVSAALGRSAAQDLPTREPILGWARNNTTEVELRDGTLHVWGVTGSVRTTRVHSDLVLRFEFRTEDNTQAYAWVRSAFGETGASSLSGYGVILADRNNDASRVGRIERRGSGANIRHMPLAATGFPTLPPNGWHTCEIRMEGSTISVDVDGRTMDIGEGVETFVGHVGFTTHTGRLLVRNATVQRILSPASAFAGVLHANAPGIVVPSVIRKIEPGYPWYLREARVQAVAVLEALVLANGSVGAVRTVTSAHPDLDEEAMAAARQWTFTPATKDRVAVPVVVTIEMMFSP